MCPMNLSTTLPTTIEMFDRPALGQVVKAVSPNQRGRIKFDATYWFARFSDSNITETIVPGMLVLVVGREGITLLVEIL